MTVQLWSAIGELASAWRADDIVERVLAAMPSRNPPPRNGLAAYIERMQAGGVPCRPLWMANMYVLTRHLFAEVPDPPGLSGWLRDAKAVQDAYFGQLGWMRAQLPGFPILRLPQLAAGAPLVSSDNIRGIPWARAHFAAGYQTMAAPPPNGLGKGHPISRAAVQVVRALAKEPAWNDFAVAQSRLTAEDRAHLHTAIAELRHELRPEAVDVFEPSGMMRRQAFRQSKLNDVLAGLSGAAAEYVGAFDEVNAVMMLSLGSGLNFLVEHRRPAEPSMLGGIDVDGTRVDFVTDDIALQPNDLVFLSDSAINEVGVITAASFVVRNGDFTMRASAMLMPGARQGLEL